MLSRAVALWAEGSGGERHARGRLTRMHGPSGQGSLRVKVSLSLRKLQARGARPLPSHPGSDRPMRLLPVGVSAPLCPHCARVVTACTSASVNLGCTRLLLLYNTLCLLSITCSVLTSTKRFCLRRIPRSCRFPLLQLRLPTFLAVFSGANDLISASPCGKRG